MIKHTNIHKRKLKSENLKALKKNNSTLQGNIKILLMLLAIAYIRNSFHMLLRIIFFLTIT